MGVKILNLYSWSSTILLLFQLCLIGHIQISNAYKFCQYYKQDQPQHCPIICCLNNSQTTNNITCCNSQSISIITTTYTLFGYHWWTIFLFTICFFLAICILFHFYKHKYISKHWKHFNSTINPSSIFIISKNDSICSNSTKDDSIILEENPPNYTNSVSPPPSYASINPSKEKILE